MRKWPPKLPPKGPNEGHWRAGRKFPWWKDENMVWTKRNRGLRQKPWNKPNKMDMFWTPFVEYQENTLTVSSTGSASIITALSGEQLANDQGQTDYKRALSHCKLHRFQGHLWVWLAPDDNSNDLARNVLDGSGIGVDPPPNVHMVTYVWQKLKEAQNLDAANSAVGFIEPSIKNTTPVGEELQNMLRRDDVMSWGVVPVFGIVPRMYTAISGISQSLTSQVIANAGMYMQNHVAKIPWPRLPKAGLNLRKGEQLICTANLWAGPGAHSIAQDTSVVRTLAVYSVARLRCSI